MKFFGWKLDLQKSTEENRREQMRTEDVLVENYRDFGVFDAPVTRGQFSSPIEFCFSDFNSDMWAKLQTHYNARLELLRAKNDGALSPEETIKLRGRINEIKLLLSLEKDTLAAQTPSK